MHLNGFELALHSFNKYFWSTYYAPGALALILRKKRQEPLQSSEERQI